MHGGRHGGGSRRGRHGATAMAGGAVATGAARRVTERRAAMVTGRAERRLPYKAHPGRSPHPS